MPKPILKTPQKVELEAKLNLTGHQEQKQKNQQMDALKLDRLLRQPRSKAYMDSIHKLDAGGHVQNKDKVSEIIHVIKQEFPDVELSGVLLGFVAICYLGKPYEVHTLDVTGEIIEHFKSGQKLPGGLEKARSIAMRGGYDFIEVYSDCCRAIGSNGNVSVIR